MTYRKSNERAGKHSMLFWPFSFWAEMDLWHLRAYCCSHCRSRDHPCYRIARPCRRPLVPHRCLLGMLSANGHFRRPRLPSSYKPIIQYLSIVGAWSGAWHRLFDCDTLLSTLSSNSGIVSVLWTRRKSGKSSISATGGAEALGGEAASDGRRGGSGCTKWRATSACSAHSSGNRRRGKPNLADSVKEGQTRRWRDHAALDGRSLQQVV